MNGRSFLLVVALVLVAGGAWGENSVKPAAADEDAVKKALIKESIAAYPGSCPCPYNVDRAGRSCGRRSAYSRPGGRSPLCYPSDVTDEMVLRYRR